MTNDKKPNTFKKIYDQVKKIPKGKVSTYGQIAAKVGISDSRVVGWALNKNPSQENIPCHRVVNKKGEVSKAFAFGGANEQIHLLKNEGVGFVSEGVVDLNSYSI